ncbi:MAG: hypothetical protein ACHP9Y_03075 [Gammaproteobacteria bacterium]
MTYQFKQSVARNPRVIVTFDNKQVLMTEGKVHATSFNYADTFDLELPLSGQPFGIDLNYWSTLTTATITVYAGFVEDPTNYTIQDLIPLITGTPDEIEVDPLHACVYVYGRDYTSKLIDTKVSIKMANQTSSQIATTFAKEHGLGQQITPTTTKVGTFYQNGQVLLANGNNEWDVLVSLAQQENFVVFVTGNTLVFEPRGTSSQNPYILQYQPPTGVNNSPIFNGISLRFIRSMKLSSNTWVTVKTGYSPRTGMDTSYTAKSTHKGKPSSNTQKFSYTIPGLTPEQAQQRANQLLHDINIHEVRLEAELIPDLEMQKDTIIQVQGTNTAFDQTFYVDHIERSFSATDMRMHVTAKNKSSTNEAES